MGARERDRWRHHPGRLLVVVVLLAVVLYPLLWMVGSSLRSPTNPITWDNYATGWRIQPFGRFFLNSLLLAGATVVANAASCLVTAYAFARLRFPGRKVWFVTMIATLLLPGHVLIIPQYLLFRQLDWVDTALPLVVPKLLATETFFVFLMVQFLRAIPHALDESARIDGCSPYSLFWWVILPLARPAIATTAIFSFIWTWNDFFTQLVYLNDLNNYTVPIGLRQFLDSTGQSAVGPMFAMSVVSLLPVFLFFVAFQRLLVAGITPYRVIR